MSQFTHNIQFDYHYRLCADARADVSVVVHAGISTYVWNTDVVELFFILRIIKKIKLTIGSKHLQDPATVISTLSIVRHLVINLIFVNQCRFLICEQPNW